MAQLYGHHTKLQKFLRFLSYKYSIPRVPHSSYSPVLSILNLETLERHRLRLGLYFAYKLFSGIINCPDFLFHFSFHVSSRSTRIRNTFYMNMKITNYAKNCPSNRIMQFSNELNIDFFVSPNFHFFKTFCNLVFNNLS
ncbi:Uncharacterized protein FWK35_00015907 [Aphis craccivora]|uniref:Uncharacterized protein n=1 Tax=Aphis craccivora TaxID=307492 RepID=A0A6G0YEK8_APHCR|nr:Uncharacterized protein FWK35_00015907 [Aphis craccivora]